ncbi:MAG: YoaK family protein [Burkholderiaceae bacterium]
MPLNYARRLTASQRSRQADRHIGIALTFVAGATNAGAFLAVHQYTSHMTGVVSSMADNLILGAWQVVLAGAGALASFLFGAGCSAVMVNFARRHRLHSEYSGPLLLEALMLLLFGVLGARLESLHGIFVPFTVALLCFTMGLQNAVITKLSRAEIRTTHMTGIVTDLGIELGKLMYWNGHLRHPDEGPGAPVTANRDRLRILSLLLSSFFSGGVAGAWAFKRLGYVSTVPLALLLTALVAIPVFDDLRERLARRWID